MKARIAVTVDENLSDLQVCDHFGRCSKFMVYDVDEAKKVVKEESYQNPLQGGHGGACQLPYYIQELGANVVIAGGMGRKAIALCNQFDIEVITAPGMTVVDALYSYLNNEISGFQPCAGHDGDCHH